MFEEARLLGRTERSIIVQTRKGTNIRNLIEPEPGIQQRRIYEALLRKYGRNWKRRKPATGVYNCAGHVWASRRTALLEPMDWKVILEEDGYRQLADAEPPLPGDLAVYVDTVNTEILHVARVLEIREGVSAGSSTIPWVLSKWSSTSGEAMHLAHDVPYGNQGFSLKTEYWTDRPKKH